MSASLLDLIKAYGDARADWAVDKGHSWSPEALAEVKVRLLEIKSALGERDADQLVGPAL